MMVVGVGGSRPREQLYNRAMLLLERKKKFRRHLRESLRDKLGAEVDEVDREPAVAGGGAAAAAGEGGDEDGCNVEDSASDG